MTGFSHPIHPWSDPELATHYRRDEHDQDHTDLCAGSLPRTDMAPLGVPRVSSGPAPDPPPGAGLEPDPPPYTALLNEAVAALGSDWLWGDLRPRIVSLLNELRFPERTPK